MNCAWQPGRLFRQALAFALISALVAQQIGGSSAFPSLFTRPLMFQRAQVQNQQSRTQAKAQQEQLSSQVRPSSELVLAANSLIPVGFMAQGPALVSRAAHPDLLRVGAPTRLHQHNPQQMHQQLEYLKQAAALSDFAVASSGGAPEPSFAAPSSAQVSASQSEIVDKIERHIDRHIEQSLLDPSRADQRQVAATGYDASASSEPEEPAEKHEEHEEPAEKRAAKKEEHEEHEEHEHPPEAFEVHHKKGGKSFQYFHQGHSS